MFRGPELRRYCEYHRKNNVKDDNIPLEPVTRKETLVASRTPNNFMVRFKKLNTGARGCYQKS